MNIDRLPKWMHTKAGAIKHQQAHNWSDVKLMLVVLEACIRAGVMPAAGSPCHDRLRAIIEMTK